MSSIEGFIIEQLSSKDIRYKDNKQWIQTYCPFHNYSGKYTHLGIRKDGKLVHCFSCGYTGTWNDYALKKNLTLITEERRKNNTFTDLLYELESEIPSVSTIVELPFFEPLDIPWRRFSTKDNYRGPDLPVEFLKKFGIKKWYDDYNCAYSLLLPVKMESELVGWSILWVGEKEVSRKAQNMPGPWVKDALYPLNYVKNSSWVVLVEGQYDALRLIYSGIPALSILGTPNWASDLVVVLQAFEFSKIFVVLDGDDPGYKTSPIIYNDLLDKISTTVVDLPKGRDPGNLRNKEIKILKKLFRENKDEKNLVIEHF